MTATQATLLVVVATIALAVPHVVVGDVLMASLERRGDLALRDAKISEAILAINEAWNVNIVVGNGVEGTVTAAFQNTPLREVLDAVLVANGYGYQRSGNTLVVMPSDAIGAGGLNLISSLISIGGGVAPQEILDSISALSTPQGKVQSLPSTNSLFVIDTPEAIQKMKQLVGQFDRRSAGASPATIAGPTTRGGEVYRISPQFVAASSLEKPLRDLMGSAAQISVIPEENQIILFGSAEVVSKAQRLVDRIDTPRQQVRITAYIYDISLTEMERLGVNWNNRVKGRSLGPNGNAADWVDINGGLLQAPNVQDIATVTTDVVEGAAGVASAASAPSQIAFQTLGGHFDLHSVVQALDETRGARLLADPSVTVIDREEASIRIVTRVPVQQLTQTEAGGNIGTTTFEEAGVTLSVTPAISADGTIQMQVSPTFSVLAGFQNNQPIIDTREATTVVRVANQQTIVIGGLRQRAEVESVRGVPRLMKWPVVGRLFRAHDTEIRESELVVFIQPEIIHLPRTNTYREDLAAGVCKQSLDRIPYAEDVPFIPHCRDKGCPYHHPRPRINPGSEPFGPNLVGSLEPIFAAPEFLWESECDAVAPLHGEVGTSNLFRLPPIEGG